MNAFNPLEAAKRLEAAGIARSHAEAIAAEIYAAKNDHGTQLYGDRLDVALDRLTIRLSIVTAVIVSLVCSILGVVLSN